MGANSCKATFWLALLALAIVPSIAWPWPSTDWRVILTNEMSNSSILKANCLSGDDNIGYYRIEPGSEISWQFGSNILRNTKFWCNLVKGDVHNRLVVFSDKNGELKELCEKNKRVCHWVAMDNEICLKKERSGLVEGPCYKWRNKK